MRADESALLAQLRTAIEHADPPPDDLADRVVAALAVDDLPREYALLTMTSPITSPVRAAAETATVQFSDGTVTVLVHVTGTDTAARRIDGWVDASPRAISLVTGDQRTPMHVSGQGRFDLTDAASGLVAIELVVDDERGRAHSFRTPQFEI